jgi:two-component system, NarL family, nitrate/nitrite response regulator NarL
MPSAKAPSPERIHVLVATNSCIHSQLLADALQRDAGLCIVGSATSSVELLERATLTRPGVVIVSAHLDDDPQGGLAALRQFHETQPQTPAIIMVDSPKREIVLEAFRAGARGIFSEHESLETLRKCVRVVFEGQVWATSREVRIALEALTSACTIQVTGADGLKLLTPRELQVVNLLAEGLTNREIGERLGLSRHTIKNYLLKIFDKVGVSNRVELLFLTLTHPASADLSEEAEAGKKAERLGVPGVKTP